MEGVKGTLIREEEARDTAEAGARETHGPLRTTGGKRRKRSQADLVVTSALLKQMVLGR